MKSNFFAKISRIKYINRWGLMRNTRTETLSEHSMDVAIIAHALGVIRNRRFGGNVNVERLALLGMYHDAAEIITGDMPTPVKYHSPEMRSIYGEIEDKAAANLLSMLPKDLLPDFTPLLRPAEEDSELWRLVKAADKLSALIKCIEEEKMGNREFDAAADSTVAAIKRMELPEADCFMEEFLPGYSLTLDEQN